jgi:hypothetical protein
MKDYLKMGATSLKSGNETVDTVQIIYQSGTMKGTAH